MAGRVGFCYGVRYVGCSVEFLRKSEGRHLGAFLAFLMLGSVIVVGAESTFARELESWSVQYCGAPFPGSGPRVWLRMHMSIYTASDSEDLNILRFSAFPVGAL